MYGVCEYVGARRTPATGATGTSGGTTGATEAGEASASGRSGYDIHQVDRKRLFAACVDAGTINSADSCFWSIERRFLTREQVVGCLHVYCLHTYNCTFFFIDVISKYVYDTDQVYECMDMDICIYTHRSRLWMCGCRACSMARTERGELRFPARLARLGL